MNRSRTRLWLGVAGMFMLLIAIGMAWHRAPPYPTIGLAFLGLLCLILVLFLIPTDKWR